MNVGIVNHHDFRSNSGIHVFNLGNSLAALGVEITAYVPGDPGTVADLGEANFRVRAATDLGNERLDLVHAWTPREGVRVVTSALARKHQIPYVVHLEDNEDVVALYGSGLSPVRLRQLSPAQLHQLVRDLPGSSSLRYQPFLEAAHGVTAVVERLLEFAPGGVPTAVFWPASEPDFFRPAAPDLSLRRELGIGHDEQVVVYAGNSHVANADEVRALYLAVGLVNRRGIPLRLVRLGVDHGDFRASLGPEALRYEILVSYVPRALVARYFALADVLVQPGRPDPFNDYRFPSKIPEFLAMGKPVILPATNIGLELEEGAEAMLLHRGDALELARVVEKLLADPELRRRLGAGARRFAERRLSWERSAQAVARLYADVLDARRRPPD